MRVSTNKLLLKLVELRHLLILTAALLRTLYAFFSGRPKLLPGSIILTFSPSLVTVKKMSMAQHLYTLLCHIVMKDHLLTGCKREMIKSAFSAGRCPFSQSGG